MSPEPARSTSQHSPAGRAHGAAGQGLLVAVPPRLPPAPSAPEPCQRCWAGVAAILRTNGSSSEAIYWIARNEREEADDNMFPVPCFAQISSRQHVCVCKGLSVPLPAASKQGSSKLSKAYSPPSNTTLTLETVHGFDTPVGFLPTSLCQRLPGGSSRFCLAFDGETGGRWRPAPRPSPGCHCSSRGDVPQDPGCPATNSRCRGGQGPQTEPTAAGRCWCPPTRAPNTSTQGPHLCRQPRSPFYPHGAPSKTRTWRPRAMALTPLPTVLLSSSAAGEQPRALGSWSNPRTSQGPGTPQGWHREVGRLRLAQHKAPGGAQIWGSPAGNQGTSSPADSKRQHRELPAVPQELPVPFWALSHCTDLCR